MTRFKSNFLKFGILLSKRWKLWYYFKSKRTTFPGCTYFYSQKYYFCIYIHITVSFKVNILQKKNINEYKSGLNKLYYTIAYIMHILRREYIWVTEIKKTQSWPDFGNTDRFVLSPISIIKYWQNCTKQMKLLC